MHSRGSDSALPPTAKNASTLDRQRKRPAARPSRRSFSPHSSSTAHLRAPVGTSRRWIKGTRACPSYQTARRHDAFSPDVRRLSRLEHLPVRRIIGWDKPTDEDVTPLDRIARRDQGVAA